MDARAFLRNRTIHECPYGARGNHPRRAGGCYQRLIAAMSETTVHTHCILCGIHNLSELSLHPTPFVVDLVKQRHVPGPIVFPAVTNWALPLVCACRLCFHQLRRRVKANRPQKQLLPMDATLLQTLIPGQMRQQDSRTKERMRSALRAHGNSYSTTFEALLQLVPKEGDQSAMRAWWKYNLQTEFFSHKTTARLARKSLLTE